MKKAWKQTWKNLLFQHFEINDITLFKKHLPKNCSFHDFNGKYYIGLVSMNMTNVKHNLTGDFVWFKNYNELNVRTYIIHDNKPGVLFLSLDVDSLISIFGARTFYGLPYRKSTYITSENRILSYRNSKLQFESKYTIDSESKTYEKDTFANWSTERYFFANKYLGLSFKGEIFHKPWELSTAIVENQNLAVLDNFDIKEQYPQTLFCKEINLQTSKLSRI